MNIGCVSAYDNWVRCQCLLAFAIGSVTCVQAAPNNINLCGPECIISKNDFTPTAALHYKTKPIFVRGWLTSINATNIYLRVIPPHVQSVVSQYLGVLVYMVQCQLHTGHDAAANFWILNTITIRKEPSYIDIRTMARTFPVENAHENETYENRDSPMNFHCTGERKEKPHISSTDWKNCNKRSKSLLILIIIRLQTKKCPILFIQRRNCFSSAKFECSDSLLQKNKLCSNWKEKKNMKKLVLNLGILSACSNSCSLHNTHSRNNGE